MKAGEERLLQTGSIAQQLRFVGFSPTGNVHDQSDRMLRFLCRSGAADPASRIQTVWAQVEELTNQQSQLFRRHFLGTESFYHDGGRLSHADRVGNLIFTTIGQASSNDVFCNITCCVRSGTSTFDGILPECSATVTCHAAVGINDNFYQPVRPQSPIGPPITKRPVGLMKNLVAEVSHSAAESA